MPRGGSTSVDVSVNKRKPFVLSLLALPLFVLKGFVLVILGTSFLPIYVFTVLTSLIVMHPCFRNSNQSGLYLLLFFPRWLVSHFSLVAFVTPTWGLIHCFFTVASEEPDLIQYIVAGTILLVQIGGTLFGFSNASYLSKKLHLPYVQWKKYGEQIIESTFDVITAIGALFVVFGIIQCKSIWDWVQDRENLKRIPFRVFIVVQIVLTILNILCVIPLVIITLFPWRLKLVFDLEKNKYDKYPRYVTEHEKTVDILRSSMWKPYLFTRATIIIQSMQAIVDIPFIVMAITVSLSWRVLQLWKDIRDPQERSVRSIIFSHFIGLLVDTPFVLVSVVLAVSILKLPVLCVILGQAVRREPKSENVIRMLLAEHFICIFLDLLSFCLLPFLFVSVWYYPEAKKLLLSYSLYHAGYRLGSGLAWNKRLLCLLPSFLIDLPFILLAGIICSTLVHLRALCANLAVIKNIWQRRVITTELFLCLLIDPIVLILFCVSWLFKLEYPRLHNQLVRHREQQVVPFSCGSQLKTRYYILENFIRTIGCFFYFVMSIVITMTIYRAPRFWRRLLQLYQIAYQEKNYENVVTLINRQKDIIFDQFTCLILEIPAWLALVLVYVMQWRWNDFQEDWSLLNEEKKKKAPQEIEKEDFKWYSLVLSTAFQCIRDMPALVCFLIVGLLYYRAPRLQREWDILWNNYKNQTLTRKKYHSALHKICYVSFIAVLLDSFVLFSSFVIILLPYHAREFFQKIKTANGLEFHRLAGKFLFLSIVDIPFMLLYIIVWSSHWRYDMFKNEVGRITLLETKENNWLTKDPRRQASVLCVTLQALDIFSIVAKVIIFITVWNIQELKIIRNREVQKISDFIHLRLELFRLLVYTILDLPYIVLCIPLYLSWRAMKFHRIMKSADGNSLQRSVVREQILCLLLDPFVWVAYLLVWCVRLRIGDLHEEIDEQSKKSEDASLAEQCREGLNIRKQLITLHYGFLTLLDLPALLLSFILLISWRRGDALEILYNKKWRSTTGILFIILSFDIPVWLCRKIIILTWWYRTYLLAKEEELRKELLERKEESHVKWKYEIKRQITVLWIFFKLLVDIPILLCALFVFATFIRKGELQKVYQAHSTNMQLLRKATIREAVIVCVSFLLYMEVAFLNITMWRRKEIVVGLAMSPKHAFWFLTHHCLLVVFIDSPFMFIFMLTFNTWRRNSLVHQWQFCSRYSDARRITLLYFFILFADLCTLYMAIVTLLASGFFKTPVLLHAIRRGWKASYGQEDKKLLSLGESFAVHWNVYVLFGFVVWKIPFYLLSLTLFVFHWRWRIYHSKLRVVGVTFRQHGFLFEPQEGQKDFTFSYFYVSIQITLQQTFCLLMDIATVLPFLLCSISWRCFNVHRKLRIEMKRSIFSMNSVPEKERTILVDQIIREFNLPGQDSLQKQKETPSCHFFHLQAHQIIMSEFKELLIDLPFVIFLPILCWRLPHTLRTLWHQTSDSRLFIFTQVIQLIIDLPFLALLLWNVLCVWKAKYNIIGLWYIPKRTGPMRKFIVTCFTSSIFDLLSLFFVLVMSLTLWKLPRLARLLWEHLSFFSIPKHAEFQEFQKTEGLLVIHKLIFAEAKAWCLDIPYVPFFLISILSPYRIFCFLMFQYGRRSLGERLVTVEHCKQVLRTWRFSDELRILNQVNTQKDITSEIVQRKKSNQASRSILFAHSIMAAEDYAVFVMSFACLLSGWRTIDFLEDIYESPRKKTILKQFRHLSRDIYALFCIIIILLFIVRIPQLVHCFFVIWKEARHRKDRIFYVAYYYHRVVNLFSRHPNHKVPKSETPFFILPDEIIYQIAQKLDYQDLCRMQQVSKRFLWLDDQQLWYEKLNQVAPLVAAKESNISYKIRYKHYMKQQQQGEPGYYSIGCRSLIVHFAKLSLVEVDHTLFLPFKVFFFLGICLEKFLHFCFPFTKAVLGLPRSRQSFWTWHTYQNQAECFRFFIIASVTLLGSSFHFLENLLWIVGTLGARFYYQQHSFFVFLRVILYLPICGILVAYMFHPLLFYFFYPTMWCSSFIKMFLSQMLLVMGALRYEKLWNYSSDFLLANGEFHHVKKEATEFSKKNVLVLKYYIARAFMWTKRQCMKAFQFFHQKCASILMRMLTVLSNFAKYIDNQVKFISFLLWNLLVSIMSYVFLVLQKIWAGVSLVFSVIVSLFYNTASMFANLVYKIIMRILKIIAYIYTICRTILQRMAHGFIGLMLFFKNALLGLYDTYQSTLASFTRTCAKMPGFFGNLLLIPICVCWIFWPCAVAFYFNYLLLFPSVLVSGFLLNKGYRIVDKNWV